MPPAKSSPKQAPKAPTLPQIKSLIDQWGELDTILRDLKQQIDPVKAEIGAYLAKKNLSDLDGKKFKVELVKNSDKKPDKVTYFEVEQIAGDFDMNADEVIDADYVVLKDKSFLQKIGDFGRRIIAEFWKPQKDSLKVSPK